jgi:hypothetical protein
MLISKEGIVFIQRAQFVFLLLESLVESDDWVIDWRWLGE